MDQSEILVEPATRYPLSSRQRDPGGLARAPQHVIALALRIKGELRVDALRAALDEVVERQESLRTRVHYDETDGNLGFQEVLPPLPVPLTVRDIAVGPGRSRDDVAVDLLTELSEQTMSFSVKPSLRASLHRFDDRDAVLTLQTHHLFCDGWSTDVLRREIAACYTARVTGVPHTLPAPVPYREFALQEQEFLQSGKAAAARRFWSDSLAGAEMLTMPADRPHGPDTLQPQMAIGNFTIDPGRFAKVSVSAAQNRCSVWHVFLAAYMVLAERVTGRSDITLFTSSSGRPSPDFYDTIGFFVNPVPLRLEFGGCETFLDLMLLARKAGAEARRHPFPFPMIVEMTPGLMNGAADPRALMPILNYINSPVAQDDTGFAASVEPVVMPEERTTSFLRGGFVWTFLVAPPGELRCCVEYEPGAVDASTIDRWGSDFIDLILTIADRPDQAWRKP
ncbi:MULTISPECIES: condensation domain-containing protein [unclassified Micromonospora]|uniref:condensation domain-containing protein n=1 Tax=unclassified Micromonospora TaxID=2617518 RepID=UPI0033B3B0AC